MVLIMLSSCAGTIAFTQPLRERINFLDDDLKKVQFYVSEKLIIRREFVNWQTEINRDHDLRQIGDHYLETVIINPNTPGMVVDAYDDLLYVSFEPDPNFYLVFCQGCSEKKKDGDLYTLLSYKMKGRELEPVDNTRLYADISPDQVLYFTEYGNQEFLIANNSHGAYLKLKNKVIKKMRDSKRVLPGNIIMED
jgi:hypothetical protein